MNARQHSVSNGTRPLPQHTQSLPVPNASGQPASALAPAIESDDLLRRRIIGLLAGTANGCIAELRYPELCTRLEQLEKSQPKFEEDLNQANALVSALKKDKEELRIEVESLRVELDRVRQSGATDASSDSASQLSESLQKAKERIERLEEDKRLLMEQNAMLHRSQTISSDGRYEVLKKKYEYVLDLIKRGGAYFESANGQDELSDISKDRMQPAHLDRSTAEGTLFSQKDPDVLSQAPSKSLVTSGAATSQRFAEDGTLAHNKGKASTVSNSTAPASESPSTLTEISSIDRTVISEQNERSHKRNKREGASANNEVMDVDTAAVNIMEEEPGHSHEQETSIVTEAKNDITDMDEESDDDCSDLTDDEANDGSKKSVMECIRAVFYANDIDERYCNLCDTRVSMSLAASSPTFTDSSLRDLVTHMKFEHPLAWEKLRKSEENK